MIHGWLEEFLGYQKEQKILTSLEQDTHKSYLQNSQNNLHNMEIIQYKIVLCIFLTRSKINVIQIRIIEKENHVNQGITV